MEFIRRLLVENLGGPFHLLASKDQSFSLNEVPDLHGKVGLVTCGTEGVGFGCTYTLLLHNISELFILSISKDKAEDALDMIEERLGSKARQAVEWKQCDLSDWEQTVRVAKEISKKTDRLDIVINNAARGVMTRQLSASNGIDLHMTTNHIGHVVLVSNLLPLLKPEENFGNWKQMQYARSKLAELLCAKHLACNLTSQYPNILANFLYPGIADTAQTNDHIRETYPILGYGMAVGLKPFRKSQFDGYVSTMYVATVCEDSGLCIRPPKIVEHGDSRAHDVQLAKRLMALTKKIIDEKIGALNGGCPPMFL